MSTTLSARKPPGSLKPANRLVVALQRFGLVIGPMHLLSVPGRKSGRMRTTPVSPLSVGGRRYVVAVFEGAQWVENARVAGWGVLSRGRRHERVGLVELRCARRAQILRKVPREVPQAARFLRQRYGIPDEPAAFEALAPRCTLFRIHSIPAEDPARAANEDTSSQTCKENRNLTPPEEAAEGFASADILCKSA